MSTTAEHHRTAPQPDALDTTVVTSWKAPIAFAVFTLVALALAVFAPREGVTKFRLSSPTDAVQLPEITVPTMPALWTVVVMTGGPPGP